MKKGAESQKGGLRMPGKASVKTLRVEELFADTLGQRWSPSTVTLEWPAAAGLRAPWVRIGVIALARGQMTEADLRKAHLRGALDVLNAAIITLEQMIESPGDADAGSPREVARTEG
jgi:hypothetical protein